MNCDTKNERKTRSRSSSVQRRKKSKSQKKTLDASYASTISDTLVHHIFSGWIGERKWVDNLKGYRDVIEVDEHEEHLNDHLKVLVNEIEGVQAGTTWINITGPEESLPCYCLWTLLDQQPIPGHYWFYIKEVTADMHFGLKISMKLLRTVQEFDVETLSQRKSRHSNQQNGNEWTEFIDSLSNVKIKDVQSILTNTITPSNIIHFFRLIIAFVVTLTMSLVSLAQVSGPTLVRCVDGLSIFIQRVTPAFQSLLGFFEKIFGGFLIFASMVFKDLRRPPPPPPRPPIEYQRPQARYLTPQDY